MNIKTFILFLCFANSGFCQVPSLEEYLKKQKERSEKITAETLERLEKDSKKEYPEIIKHFDLKKVKGTQAGWYHHKSSISKMKSRIETPVSVNGHIYLKAFLLSDTVYNATRTRVKIKNGAWESNPLAEGGSYIQRKYFGKKWREVLNHFSWKMAKDIEGRALSIISAIASTKAEEKVTLVFIGPKNNYEMVLSGENIKAIKESWKLSQYILIKNKNYLTYTPMGAPEGHEAILLPNVSLNKDDMKGVNYD
jgi:hypothetical protein